MLVWQGTKFTVFVLLSDYWYLGDGGTDRREILHDGTSIYRSRTGLLPFWMRGPKGIRNFGSKFWLFDREYLENGKSQRYIQLEFIM